MHHRLSVAMLGAATLLAACNDAPPVAPHVSPGTAPFAQGGNNDVLRFAQFTPLTSSYACTISGGDAAQPVALPAGFSQTIIASEPDYLGNPDMQAWNTNGPQPGRYLYRSHEIGPDAGVSVTDLRTGITSVLIHRGDWAGLDGMLATPWGTLLFAEEQGDATSNPDPNVPAATAGLVYELNPLTLQVDARPALGARAHEGQAIDDDGNYYGISERNGGAIFKFAPDHRSDYSSGQLYAFKLTTDLGDRTGPGSWVALDRTASAINSDVEATNQGATGYGRPEDLEYLASANGKRRVLYAALTSENRVIAIDISDANAPVVTTVVKQGINAPADFIFPDNLAFDGNGNLFVAEDPGGSFPGKSIGDDIWVATLALDPTALATSFERFASLTDCDAEPTGILFDKDKRQLFVDVQHRGGDGRDKTVAISPVALP